MNSHQRRKKRRLPKKEAWQKAQKDSLAQQHEKIKSETEASSTKMSVNHKSRKS